MADKGFETKDLTDKLGVKLNLPAFLGSREQFEVDEVINNQKIASVGIHVERYTSELKKFRLFDRPMPLGTCHYLWRGVAPKRKGLGKQNFKHVKGWVNEKQNT